MNGMIFFGLEINSKVTSVIKDKIKEIKIFLKRKKLTKI